MDDMRIHVTDTGDHLRGRLHHEIYLFNQHATGIRDARSLSLQLDDKPGDLVAGLTGLTWGGTGFIDVL